MSGAEWESLCDGCARCCLEKLEDEDTGKIYFTHVSCRLLDAGLCACKDYKNRSDQVPDCVRLTPEQCSIRRGRVAKFLRAVSPAYPSSLELPDATWG
jgi:uncharacterized cysteine cluster protein YcgN (CxxCxxCC family)